MRGKGTGTGMKSETKTKMKTKTTRETQNEQTGEQNHGLTQRGKTKNRANGDIKSIE
jgi:hypothetical protein